MLSASLVRVWGRFGRGGGGSGRFWLVLGCFYLGGGLGRVTSTSLAVMLLRVDGEAEDVDPATTPSAKPSKTTRGH